MKVILAAIAILFFVRVSDAQCWGYAKIVGTTSDPTITGSVMIYPNASNPNLFDVVIDIVGITQNLGVGHGIHIHQYGDLSATGSNAGSHWDPSTNPHGCPENQGARHYGDMGNWDVSIDGSIHQTKTLDLVTLVGTNSVVGLAVIVHNKTDNCINITSSAARLAQGVIGIANPTYVGVSSNAAVAATGFSRTTAVCYLAPIANSGVSGVVYFSQATVDSPTVVTAWVNGLVSGSSHGFHVHAFGDLRNNTGGESAGGHWNPQNNTHGIPPLSKRHVGDMGNLYYYENGTAYYTYSHDLLSLNGATNVVGHAVIVHSAVDNCAQPTGNAGSRLAYCVIGWANPITSLTVPGTVPGAQDDSACPVTTTGVATTGALVSTASATGSTTAHLSSSSSLQASFAVVIVALVAMLF